MTQILRNLSSYARVFRPFSLGQKIYGIVKNSALPPPSKRPCDDHHINSTMLYFIVCFISIGMRYNDWFVIL